MSKKETIILRTTPELAHKLKYVAWHDRETVTFLLTTSAETIIKQFEKTHGKITPEQLKAAKIVE